MKPVELNSVFGTYISFQSRDECRVPQVAGCYLITNAYHEILYIGQTDNLCRRMKEHLKDSRIIQPTAIGRATWFYFVEIVGSSPKDAEDRLLFEYVAKNGHRPVLNRIGP